MWRASLEHASTGARRCFVSLAELVAFLEQETAAVDEDELCSTVCKEVGA